LTRLYATTNGIRIAGNGVVNVKEKESGALYSKKRIHRGQVIIWLGTLS